jgi:hypothetical protein
MDRSSRAVLEDRPELKPEVRFYAERSPSGLPDAAANAQFLKDGTTFVAANGQVESANFMAELVVPNVSGGALEFVIREPNANEVVIHAPVRVTTESAR